MIGLDLFYRPTVAIGVEEVPEYPTRSFSDSALNNEYINLLTVINAYYRGDVFVRFVKAYSIK